MAHTARLIAITKPIAEDLNEMTAEDLVVYMARVSSPKNQYNTETAPKLLKFLLREGHVSPFQMVTVSLELTTTRAVSRQLIRHRSLNVQEYSGRYAKMSEQMVPQECRLQDKTNRQKSLETDDPKLHAMWDEAQKKVWDTAMQAYEDALANGVAKEVARSLLPEGLVESRLYITATLRDLMFYLKQRLGNGTQKEHCQLAQAIADAVRPHFPNTFEAMEF
ncbi:MAG: thyX [Gammaproteobacteria bacterium]|jgi:thymidylate synthase (FAD)|nr:thyX [Gammaproteobacteria bacterium]